MTQTVKYERRSVRISVLQHRNTDLMLAISHDLPGLMVPGRSEDELMAKIPDAVQELLVARAPLCKLA